ncbi:MAG: MATE family efflux transporter [Clostridia bacterium]|nr:MATE family efflux transporter [Clostridia bacterium]
MNKLIGDKAFYKRILALMIPIAIQNGITNFVNMLDNVMVGRLGSGPMSGVSIANQMLMIYNFCLLGVVAGAGIFGAQFVGREDYKNFKSSLRFRLYLSLVVSVAAATVLLTAGGSLTNLFLKGEGSKAEADMIFNSAKGYISVIVFGFLPYSVSMSYTGALRETGDTKSPMRASFLAVFVNLILNYLLIFGNLGLPKLGVKGAALATVISRFAEMFYLVIKAHFVSRNVYFVGVFKTLKVPLKLGAMITKKSVPLMFNEMLWGSSFAFLTQSYSLKGLSVVAATNICNTFWEVFGVSFIAAGVTVSIVVGQQLGAGEHKTAKETAYKMICFSFFIGVLAGGLYAAAARFIPLLYNVSGEIRDMAFYLILIEAVLMPFDSLVQACYFAVRSGGKVWLTTVFDSGFAMLVIVPIAFILARFTSMSIYEIYFLSKGAVIIKCILGVLLIRSNTWINTLGKDL